MARLEEGAGKVRPTSEMERGEKGSHEKKSKLGGNGTQRGGRVWGWDGGRGEEQRMGSRPRTSNGVARAKSNAPRRGVKCLSEIIQSIRM